jgi:regulator of protease activity HflC (stomatin/prohibitin superfamily)
MGFELAALIAGIIVVLAVALTVIKTVRIVPQARARNVERLGRYRKTLEPGMNVIIPFIDRVKPLIDLREQVVSFLGQPVITEDNLVVKIDTVLFFQVTDPRAADYEIVDYIQAIEQLTATMLRSVIGSMDLEVTLTSRDKINTMLRGVLDDASGKWGIRVTRVEIKAIDPPKSVIDAMEKQMRAEREKRAAILTAEGVRQSQILTADGDKQGTVLRAEGDKQSAILRAEGQAQAIGTVFGAIHEGDPDPKLLAYQYLQTLPQLAQGPGNTVWMIPSELTSALKTLSSAFDATGGGRDAASAVGPAPAGRADIPAPAGRADGVAPAGPADGAPSAGRPDRMRPVQVPAQPGPGELSGLAGPAELSGLAGPAELPAPPDPAALPDLPDAAEVLAQVGPAEAPDLADPADLQT